ncbi:MAG: hypothetical protein ACPGPE_15495 [Planctomycetota bacterium]
MTSPAPRRRRPASGPLDLLLRPISVGLVRFERPLSWIAVIWSVLSIAAHARFISLPDVPYITDRNAWMFAAPWNAIWWGFLRPEIERRVGELQLERAGETQGEADS